MRRVQLPENQGNAKAPHPRGSPKIPGVKLKLRWRILQFVKKNSRRPKRCVGRPDNFFGGMACSSVRRHTNPGVGALSLTHPKSFNSVNLRRGLVNADENPLNSGSQEILLSGKLKKVRGISNCLGKIKKNSARIGGGGEAASRPSTNRPHPNSPRLASAQKNFTWVIRVRTWTAAQPPQGTRRRPRS